MQRQSVWKSVLPLALASVSSLLVAATTVPAKIEAEAYTSMAGVQLETCSEGGQDVGWIDTGDWMAYSITVPTTGSYTIQYRVASPNSTGVISSDLNAGATVLGTVAVPNTGGWQTWTTVSQTVTLTAGTYNLGVFAKTGGFNLNWINIVSNSTPSTATTIPAKIEAEKYSTMSGVQLETCSEGGQDVGWIDTGDWMVYPINVPTAGTYKIEYRVASPNTTGVISADLNGGATQLGTVAVPSTGGWQAWTTISQTVTLPAGTSNLGIFAKSGGFNLNWLNITAQSTPSTLIPLASGRQMTVQFANNTNGNYTNKQIYVAVVARNSSGQLCHMSPDGTMTPCAVSDNGPLYYSGSYYANYFYAISDFAGFQFPATVDSGRLYVSMGQPLYIKVNQDVNGNIGVAFPDINNPSDANQSIYFDWVEFAVLNNNIWCNTTQVDQFGLPMTMELFTGSANSYQSFAKVGITESRASIMTEYSNEVPVEFNSLKQNYRIIAPTHGGFKTGGAYATYFDAYRDAIWSQYTGSDLVITVPNGTFRGRVQSDGRMRFTQDGSSSLYYVSKPSIDAIFQGSGALATGNTIELVLEAQICAAFHRHVMGNSATWNTPSAYYQTGPADYFSAFWHRHSINGRAYGFCYDDVNDQSSTMASPNPRGLIIGIGW